MVLNETPVKTSNNFHSNNIELKEFEVPAEVNQFINRSIYR